MSGVPGPARQLRTTAAPAPAHSFAQGAVRRGLLAVAGQGPQDPADGTYLHPGDVGAQTTRTLANVGAVLAAGGAGWADVLMLRVYLTQRADFPAMNAAYAAFLAEHGDPALLPARTTVFVALPHPRMLVEIDALAAVG